jgi:hypothetical protein
LGLYATIDQNWEQLAVENLFNKGSWSSPAGNNDIRRGRWRTVRLKARVLPTCTDSTGAGSGLNHPNIEMSQGLLRASGFFPTGAPQNLLSAAGFDLEWPKFQA